MRTLLTLALTLLTCLPAFGQDVPDDIPDKPGESVVEKRQRRAREHRDRKRTANMFVAAGSFFTAEGTGTEFSGGGFTHQGAAAGIAFGSEPSAPITRSDAPTVREARLRFSFLFDSQPLDRRLQAVVGGRFGAVIGENAAYPFVAASLCRAVRWRQFVLLPGLRYTLPFGVERNDAPGALALNLALRFDFGTPRTLHAR